MINNRQLTTTMKIGGHTVPVLSWQCHLTSYGNLCTFETKTSIQQLRQVGFDDIFTVQQNNFTLECQILLVDASDQNDQIVFDGIVDTVNATWEDDIVEVTGRDVSAVLRDRDDTLDQYITKTVSQVVQGIIDTVNASPENANLQIKTAITTADQIAGIRASTFQGENWAMSTSPQPTWKIIQELAEAVGYVAYMDRFKTLHFEQPGSGASHTFNWRPAGPNAENPILTLDIMQQSRRCSNFTLRLHGTDVNGKQTIYVDKKRGSGTGHFYHKSRQDLTGQNYDQIAENLADEIERKNTVVKMTVEGDTSLNVNDQVRIIESTDGELLGMNNRPLFITSILHSFEMPDYGSTEAAGFLTHITCNQVGSAGDSGA